jgi:sugar lactone lactonase YvrE
LYYSDSGNYYKPNGGLCVARPGGRTEHLFGGDLNYPNGLAIDPEEEWLYVIQSKAYNILRFRLGKDGKLAEPEIWISLNHVFPDILLDGLAFARSGNLYVACYLPNVILVIDRDRRVDTVVQDFGGDVLNQPTNVAFGKEDTKLYYANLGGYHVNELDVGEKGMALRYPKI